MGVTTIKYQFVKFLPDIPHLKTYVVFLRSGSILEPQQLSQGVSNHVKLQSEVNKLPKLPLALTSALNYQLGASWVSMPERLLLKSAVGLVLDLNVIFELILKHCKIYFSQN